MKFLAFFKTDDEKISLKVALEGETVWLNLEQITELFERDKSVISRHIKNIFVEGELDRNSVVAKNATTAIDGKIYQVDYYNLDVIISVGYRVKSQRGVQFRKWATQILNQYLVQGYALNQKRLEERNIETEQMLSLLSSTLTNQSLIKADGESILRVIRDYAKSWTILQSYDEQSLVNNKTEQINMASISFQEALNAINVQKKELIDKQEATHLFGQLRGNGLESALATIEQGFGEYLFYPNVASRSAHLLYFIIKNHPFVDGNKRIGSFLFLLYLQRNQNFLVKPVEQLINDNTLIALALLVAESKPEQKELMIRLIENLIILCK
ncbi:MAG: virulence protein RhuM/Fic/DOC family protein [Thiotrichaceae bacterium]|nr:virulence protein RhuM/Fic/DOC family protein [Thiotrichaceae bacterium]